MSNSLLIDKSSFQHGVWLAGGCDASKSETMFPTSYISGPLEYKWLG